MSSTPPPVATFEITVPSPPTFITSADASQPMNKWPAASSNANPRGLRAKGIPPHGVPIRDRRMSLQVDGDGAISVCFSHAHDVHHVRVEPATLPIHGVPFRPSRKR